MVLVVGIPSRDEASTIANVTATVDRGLSELFPGEQAFIVNADNASQDGTVAAFQRVQTRAKKISINTGRGDGIGKGTNVLAILEAAADLNADAVCLIDGDVRSIQPQWLKQLFEAALQREEATFVTPEYARSRYEANSTNQLVVPYIRAAFGLDIRQPIGGEFAMNRALVNEALTWNRFESTQLYGIDIWLTLNTALNKFHLEDVFIGRKMHSPTFPKIFKLGQQVLDALFRLMMENRPAQPLLIASPAEHWMRIDESNKSPLRQEIISPVAARSSEYIFNNWDELAFTFPALLGQRRPAPGMMPRITTALWSEILTEAYAQLTIHSFRRVRDHMVGLFPARVMTYWEEIHEMTAYEVDAYLETQARRTAELFANRQLPTTAVDLSSTPELNGGHWVLAPASVN